MATNNIYDANATGNVAMQTQSAWSCTLIAQLHARY